MDAGAVEAVKARGKSLLAAGVTGCEGEFGAGDVVRVLGPDGREFARGFSKCDAATVRGGRAGRGELVHRDDLVVL